MTTIYERKKINQGFSFVIGCDEVGRGCLAGPVVAAAVAFPNFSKKTWVHKINDSKLLLPVVRQELSALILDNCVAVGIGVVGEKKIDAINIHHASLLAMQRAVRSLTKKVSCEAEKIFLYVDGKFLVPSVAVSQQAVVDGDAKIFSVAAASIVAKVYRDRLMEKFDEQYPGYNFSQHKGYATLQHRVAIEKIGISKLHRLSFCKQYIK